MSPDDFRRIALGFPHAVEAAHMGHPDFRVEGKIFASLAASGARGTVKLNPDQQDMLMSAEPGMFNPCNGAWGLKGWTNLELEAADLATARSALTMAWLNRSPKKLAEAFREAEQ